MRRNAIHNSKIKLQINNYVGMPLSQCLVLLIMRGLDFRSKIEPWPDLPVQRRGKEDVY